MYIVNSTVDGAWSEAFDSLSYMAESGFKQPSRDGDVVGEELNAVLVVLDPTRNIVTNPIRKMPMRYAVGELLWYLSGSNQTEDIAQFSKVWERLSDDGVTANSAYGYRIFHKFGFDQWDYVKGLLSRDPLSRQAVIHIKDPSNTLSKDVPCTVALQFFIRSDENGDSRLHLTVYMRSNDVWMGVPYDMFSFCCLQMKMAMELGVKVGTYTHIAGSLHLYERDYETAKKNKMEALPCKATQD